MEFTVLSIRNILVPDIDENLAAFIGKCAVSRIDFNDHPAWMLTSTPRPHSVRVSIGSHSSPSRARLESSSSTPILRRTAVEFWRIPTSIFMASLFELSIWAILFLRVRSHAKLHPSRSFMVLAAIFVEQYRLAGGEAVRGEFLFQPLEIPDHFVQIQHVFENGSCSFLGEFHVSEIRGFIGQCPPFELEVWPSIRTSSMSALYFGPVSIFTYRGKKSMRMFWNFLLQNGFARIEENLGFPEGDGQRFPGRALPRTISASRF